MLARWGFPELRLAGITAVLVVSGAGARSLRAPAGDRTRTARRARRRVDRCGASVGRARGARLRAGRRGRRAACFRDDRRRPADGAHPLELTGLGLQIADLQPAERQRVGSAEYVGRDTAGKPLTVRVLGRDAQDTQRLARRWRSLAYRDPGQGVAVGRVEQVEHEALATLMAATAGVRVPAVVTAALGPTATL